MPILNLLVSASTAFGLMVIGGGLYEFLVIDPYWPRRPDLIQTAHGGINRKRFWIPIHVAFELMLIASLVLGWRVSDVRFWLLLALASHGTMRIWSALDFIPKALAFEKATTVDEDAARAWSRRSRLRFPLDSFTCFCLFAALWAVCRG
jgi:hypothetical protein